MSGLPDGFELIEAPTKLTISPFKNASGQNYVRNDFLDENQRRSLRPEIQSVYDNVSPNFGGLRVTSAYRSPEYNSKIGGARGSQHMHGSALDISLQGLDEGKQRELVGALLADPSVGGIGFYNNGSIHVDTRKGQRAAWGPDRTRNSLGDTPQWFQELTAQWQGNNTPKMAMAYTQEPMQQSKSTGNSVMPVTSALLPPVRPQQQSSLPEGFELLPDGFELIDDSQGGLSTKQFDDRFAFNARPNIQSAGNVDAAKQRLASNLRQYEDATNSGGLLSGPLTRSVTNLYTLGDETAGAAAATAQFAKQLLTGQGLDSATQGAGQAYGDAKEVQQIRGMIDQEQSPNASMAGNILGMLTGGGVAKGFTAAPTLLGRVGQGAVAGGTVGAISGFGEGEGLRNSLEGAVNQGATGALIGGLLPPAIEATGFLAGKAGQLAKAPFNMVRDYRNPSAAAEKQIAAALQRDAQNAGQSLAARQSEIAQSGVQTTSVADLGGETVKSLARRAANVSPEARDMLKRATNDVFENQSDGLTSIVKGITGVEFDNPLVLEKLKKAAEAANAPAYRAAYAKGQAIWDDGLEQLSQAPVMQEAIRMTSVTAKNRAPLEGMPPIKNPFAQDASGKFTLKVDAEGNRAIPNLQFWDHVKRNLDGIRSPEAQAYSRALRDYLDGVVPEYQKARLGAKAFFDAEDAIDAGKNFVKMSGSVDEGIRNFFKMPKEEQALFRQGFASELIDKINKVGDRRNVINMIYNSPSSRKQINAVFGKYGAQRLESYLRVSDIQDGLRVAVQGNSTSTQQILDVIGNAAGSSPSIGLSAATLAGFATGGVSMSVVATGIVAAAARQASLKIDQRVSKEVGKLLVSQNPKDIERLIALASKNKTIGSALNATQGILGRLLANDNTSPIQAMGIVGRSNLGQVPLAAEDNQPNSKVVGQ